MEHENKKTHSEKKEEIVSSDSTKAESKEIVVKKTEEKKPKKTEAIVRAEGIPISTKDSTSVCRFIKGKRIAKAIEDLELVLREKKAVQARGEHAHRKGRTMAGGIYPKKVSKNFIILLKSLAANAPEMNDPVIVEAVANIGQRPYGRFGRYRKKRTHIFIKAVEKKVKVKVKTKGKEK